MKTNFKQINFIYLLLGMIISGSVYGQENQYATKVNGTPTFGQTKSGPILYDQMYDVQQSFIYANEFTNEANDSTSSELADDFYVPETETWNIGAVAVSGGYADSVVGNCDTLNIRFYADFPDKPGDTLYEFFDVTDFITETELVNGYTMTYFEIQLPETVTLEEGHYWLSVQAKGDFNEMGQWGWSNHWNGNQPPTANQWHFRNMTVFPDWASAWDVIFILTTWDLSFKIFSESFENDLAVVDITSPTDGILGYELITVTVKNEGTTSQTGFDIKYDVGGTEVTENFGTETIEPEEFATFTFATTADFFDAGIHNIIASTMLTNDEYTDNDSFTKEVLCYGDVYEMENGVTDATITTCGATMVDPGGLYDDFDTVSHGRITIYPETEGTQLRLTFIEFDIDWGTMTFYDGDDITDPSLGTYNKGTGSPGVITAFNEDGVLTVDFESSNWSNGSGWVAYMSCYDPVDDDFAILDLTLNKNTVNVGNFVTVTAVIQNYGNTTQSKDVTFTANGEEIDVINTGDLELFEITTVEATWNPQEIGMYLIEVSIPEDDGTDDNNSRSLTQEVGEATYLYEGFENPEWPPEGWEITEGTWQQWDGGMFGSYHAECWVPPGSEDTLISPMLNILDGDEVSFYLKGNPWWFGDTELIHKFQDSDEWTSVVTIDAVSIGWGSTLFTEDLSDYAGIGQIAFVALGDVSFWALGRSELDEINGPALHINNNDLAAFEFDGPITPEVGVTATYILTVKNTGVLPQLGTGYTVKLMQEPGIDLVTLDGVDLMPQETAEFILEYEFPIAGAKTIYGMTDLPTDDYEENNNSTPLFTHTVQEGTTTSEIGEGTETDWFYPLCASSGYHLSESLYHSFELDEAEGNITGIAYFYTRDDITVSNDIPTTVWIGETELFEFELGSDNWVVPSELELAFEGFVNVHPGENMLYIPFDFPYNYGGENLVVMVWNPNDDDWFGSTLFYNHETPLVATKWASELNFVPDPEDPSDLYTHDELRRPNTTFYISPLLEYCTPETVNGTANGYYVDGVVLEDIDNTATGSIDSVDYNNYSNEMSTNLQKSTYYELTIQPVAAGENTICAWIDYNSDLDFEDEGEMICRITHNADVTEIKIPIVVPEDTEVGIKRLRIRSGIFGEEYDACISITDGETEDYNVNIIEAIQEFYPIDDFTATLDDEGNVDLNWSVPDSPGRAYLEGFEGTTFPPAMWEVKTSTSLDGELTDPTGDTWMQYGSDLSNIYNGMYSVSCAATAENFNWLISPVFMPFGDDEVSFMLNYTSNTGGYSKFYVIVGTEEEMTTVLEYTDESDWSNNYDSLVSISLNQFAGEYIRVAFVTENNDAYDVMIDDIVVTAGQTLDSKGYEDLTKYYLYKNGSLFYFITDPSVTSYFDEVSETENYEYCIVAYYGDNVTEPDCDDVTFVAPLSPPIDVMATADGPDVDVTWLAPGEGIFRFEDDFESYNLTDALSEQNYDDYHPWSNNPGDAQDPFVVDDYAFSGSQSLHINVVNDTANDILVKFGDKISGKYLYSCRIYIPTSRVAHFYVLQEYEYTVGASMGFQIFFDNNGTGSMDGGGFTTAVFNYNYDEWIHFELIIDLDNDLAEVYLDDEMIHEYVWSTGIYGTQENNELSVAGFDAYQYEGTPEYYVDDLKLIQLFDVEGGPDSYNIYRNDNALGTAENTFYQDMGVSTGAYTYCVSAMYDEGESDTDCDDVNVVSEIQVPQNFDAVVSGADVNCTWDVITSEELLGYRVYDNDVDISGLITATEYLDVEVSMGTHEYYVIAEFESGISDPSNSVVIVITGLEKNLAEIGTLVYPNPVSDVLNIKSDYRINSVRVINATGQVVFEDQNVENNMLNINFNTFHTGVYYVRVNTENGMGVQKIIKR